ncbi:MAG: precorrin-8X methylmutase [Aphanocapsa feldmannii 288cV]|nr:MAG: precorrin-8X methylmutase [Aphanocapsa feldmannii 288cV]
MGCGREGGVTQQQDHPIFTESMGLIQARLGHTGLAPLQQAVLERLIHSSGDFALRSLLRCREQDCRAGLRAMAAGTAILTDTAMAAAAVAPMARRSFGNPVVCALDSAPAQPDPPATRAAEGMAVALRAHARPVVLIGSAPTALMRLLALVEQGHPAPALVVGMPVGFVGVLQAKAALARSGLPQVRLEGSRGGAALVAAVANALLRQGWLERPRP